MMNLNRLLKTPLRQVPIRTAIFLLVIALTGFADSAYLTVEHYRGVIPPCSVTVGCENVLTSQYSSLFGLPISILGVVFYLIVLVASFTYLDSKKTSLIKLVCVLTIPAFLASMYFIYLQIFIIHSYCTYCLGSAITSTILFVTAMEILKKYQDE